MISLSRNTKICSFCGKTFIVPGSCQDYLYKRGKLYYCGYNHWLTADLGKYFDNLGKTK